MFYSLFPSPLGPLLLASDGTHLTGLWMETQNVSPTGQQQDALPVFQVTRAWLEDYFAGNHREPDFPFSPAGTDFQRRIWNLLLTIPYGETTTYGALASALSPKMSPQAVGQAVGKNPISIIIPCHRCIGAGGKLTGYAGGIENKQWLLRHEEETK